MKRPPDFRDIAGDDLGPEERARLERVHDILVAVGPPPELPASLADVPAADARASVSWLPRRRLGTALILAAALVLSAFGGGYLLGARNGGPSIVRFDVAQTAVLAGGTRIAVVRFGERDANGNWPMLVTVQGLSRQQGGGYYTLQMTKNGKPLVSCGTFNVRDERRTTLRFSVAYDPKGFDGLLLARYRHADHKELPLLRAKLV